jgi:HAD superfamily hydrolase (TIGR01484 family)
MPSPRLIAIDMDGTLLGSDARVSPRNLAALRAAEEAGVEIVIATGRRHSYAMRVLREHNLRSTDALISSNGTVVRTIGSDLIHCSHMPLETARWICDHISDFREILVVTFDTVREDGDDSRGALVCEETHTLHASINQWMAANEPYIHHVARIEDALLGEPPIQMMLCGSIARMREAEAHMLLHPKITGIDDATTDAEITLHRTEYPERDLCIVDILPAGCSKASALDYLAAQRGIATDDILAIGDNWNDLPMLRLAGSAALMSNAPEELKQIARASGWSIVPTNLEDGVAVAIEEALAAAPAAR